MLHRTTFFILAFIFLFTGTRPLLSESSSADTFLEVDHYLETGGIVYAFIDVEGDLTEMVNGLNEILDGMRSVNPQAANIPEIPLSTIVEHTGFNSIRAIGISSTELENGFQNRTFFLTDGKLRGFLSAFGSENQPFEVLKMAPIGADMAVEYVLDTDAVINVIRNAAVSILGENGNQIVDLSLLRPIGQGSFTLGEIVSSLNGRVNFILDVDESKSMEIPNVGKFPKIEFLVRLDSAGHMGGKIAELLMNGNFPNFDFETDGDIITMDGFIPADFGYDIGIQGNQSTGEMFIYSSPEFLSSCTGNSSEKLGNSPDFIGATKDLPETGIALTYISPSISSLPATYFETVMQAVDNDDELVQPNTDWLTEGFFCDFPIASVTSVTNSGIFVKSNWNTSHKSNLATLAMVNPVTIGLMAAMAIPAFQKVRETSQEKAVTNNLRILASAAQQFMVDNEVRIVRTEELIGPDAYLYRFDPVMGETYPEVITADTTEIHATLPDGKSITYQY